MAKRPDGSGLVGWSLFCGVPATIAGFAIGGPLGLATLAATVAAFKHGSALERQARDELELERLRDIADREKRIRDAELPALREAWETECAALQAVYDEGDIDGDEYEERMNALIERWPR